MRRVSGAFLMGWLVLGRPGDVGGQAVPTIPQLFHSSHRCVACHTQIVAPDGQDVSIGFQWRSSMMGNSGRDPYWMAGVRRETLDHPSAAAALEDKCTVCHLPIARTLSVAMGVAPQAFVHFPGLGGGDLLTELGRDGVSCSVCHQIRNEGLGSREGFTGGYRIDLKTPMGNRPVFGPFQVDAGRRRVMASASDMVPEGVPFVQTSELCASCHTLFTHALDPEGNVVGELPEQTPYLEWLESSYRGEKTCQACHMPEVLLPVPVSGVLPLERTGVSRHQFMGGNFLLPLILNKHREELGVEALSQDLEATSRAALDNLATETAALEFTRLSVANGVVEVGVRVMNLAGHKLPTGYPSRRVWLHLVVKDGEGRVLFESGALRPDGAIVGNDNDEDPSRFEPHYTRIVEPGQVQIYEDIMVDYAGRVTTGLLAGARYIKDNRLLPRGFRKETASPEVAVHGEAARDSDFVGGEDVVLYAIPVGTGRPSLRVTAELWYQPIGYRWAENLGGYDTLESARFLEYFRGVAARSAALLARLETGI